MSYTIENHIKKITEYFENQSYIRGAVALGSYGRGELDEFSDIDLYLFGDESENWQKFMSNPIHEFSKIFGQIEFFLRIPGEEGPHNLKGGLWIIYLPKTFIKTELHFETTSILKNEQSNFALFFRESRIKNPDRCVLIDKDNLITQYLVKISQKTSIIDIGHKFEIESTKFLNYFESFFTHFSRGDLYRAHMLHNLCFYKISTLIYLDKGNTDYVFLPKNLTNKILTNESQTLETLHRCSSTMDPYEMKEKITRMFSFFRDLVIKSKYNTKFTDEFLKSFQNQVLHRYQLFYNFRDLGRSMISEPKLVKGKIFRSGTLTKYNTNEIINLLIEKNIKMVIDFRNQQETEKNPYDIRKISEKIQDLKYHNLQISITDSYIKTLEIYKEQYYNALKIISEDTSGNTLIHCVGGVDRTGIMIALLYKILNIPEYKIIEDFQLNIREPFDDIKTILNYLEKRGGIKQFFIQYIEISEIIESTKNRLLSKI